MIDLFWDIQSEFLHKDKSVVPTLNFNLGALGSLDVVEGAAIVLIKSDESLNQHIG